MTDQSHEGSTATFDEDDDVARIFALEREALRCPVSVFSRMARREPVRFVPSVGLYFVTRYELITEIVRRTDDFSSETASGKERHSVEDAVLRMAEESGDPNLAAGYATTDPRVLVFSDPPRHTRHRSLINRAFTPARVRHMEPMITEIADGLIDGFIDRGSFEFLQEYSLPLSNRVIARSLRCADEDAPALKDWADDLLVAHAGSHLSAEVVQHLARSRLAFDRFFVKKIAEVRGERGSDLIGDIVHGQSVDGEAPLTDDEMMQMFQQFVLAGSETSAKALGNMIVFLARRTELGDQLRADPALIAPFIEEMLRLDGPTQFIYRTAKHDTEVGGVHIPAGASVVLHWASASRDPAIFEDPESFRLDRERNPHLTFGHGPHFCVGAPLARAEMRIGLDRLLQRVTDIALEIDEAALEPFANSIIHGFVTIPIQFERRHTPT